MRAFWVFGAVALLGVSFTTVACGDDDDDDGSAARGGAAGSNGGGAAGSSGGGGAAGVGGSSGGGAGGEAGGGAGGAAAGGAGGAAGGGGAGGAGLCAPSTATPTADDLAEVKALFTNTCSHCHGSGNSFGNIEDIFDVETLKDVNIIAETAEDSLLFQKVDDGEMPPPGMIDPVLNMPVTPVTEEQVCAVRHWIDGGAPSLVSPFAPGSTHALGGTKAGW